MLLGYSFPHLAASGYIHAYGPDFDDGIGVMVTDEGEDNLGSHLERKNRSRQ